MSKVENRSVNMYINGKPVYNEIGSMERAYSSLNREVKKLDRSSKEYRDGVKQLRQLKGNITAHRRDIGQMESAYKRVHAVAMGFLGAMGIAGGFQMLAGVIRNGTKVVMDYQDANANLQAVLGLTKEQTAALREQQLRLGSSTAFTASNAAEAQTELAKLGFTLNEITSLTPSVLSLAAASGTDLANAASIAGSNMRQFGLDASQADRVVNVMAKSFSTSALDIEKFSIAMAAAGPVASKVGVSLERATAQIGVLVDTGIDASTAGTALRNIFLDLASSGMTYEEAMHRIRNSTDSVKESFDLFGKRGATVGLVLAQNEEKLGKLEEGLNNAGDAAKEMAEEKLDTLRGDIVKLESAYEGFILRMENGDGTLANTSRRIVQLSTDVLGFITNLEATQKSSGVGIFDILLGGGKFSDKLATAGIAIFIDNMKADIDKKLAAEDYNAVQKYIENLDRQRSVIDVGSKAWEMYTNEIERVQKSMAKTAMESTDLTQRLIELGIVKAKPDLSGLEVGEDETKATSKADTRTPEEIRAEKAKEALAALRLVKEEEELLLMDERARGKIDEEQFQAEMLEIKMAYLLVERDTLEEIGMSVVDTERRIAEMRIAELNKLDAAQAADDAADRKRHEEKLARLDEESKAREEAARAAIESAAMTGASAVAVGDSAKDQARAVLNSSRQIVKSYIAQAVAAQMAEVLSKVPPPFSFVLAAAAAGAASMLFDSLIPAFATGTRSAPGGLSLVGEQGPELVNLPPGAGVSPAADTRNLLYGQDDALNFGNVPTLSGSNGSNDIAELRATFTAYADRVDVWARELKVINSKRTDDDWNDRYNRNERLVRNVK